MTALLRLRPGVVRILFGIRSDFAPKKREAMKKLAALTLSLFVTVGIVFADTPKDTPKAVGAQPAKSAAAAKPKPTKTAEKSDSAIAAEIEELRQALQAQQEQFHQALQSQQEQLTLLKEELAKRDHQIDEARDTAAAANSRAAEASSKATEAVNTSVAMKSTADTLNTTVANLSASNAVLKSAVETTKQADTKKADEEGPASIRYKGITLTPSGFIAAETVTR